MHPFTIQSQQVTVKGTCMFLTIPLSRPLGKVVPATGQCITTTITLFSMYVYKDNKCLS